MLLISDNVRCHKTFWVIYQSVVAHLAGSEGASVTIRYSPSSKP